MDLQWMDMRIQEEQERRQKEAKVLERLPLALDEIREEIARCVERYTAAFGAESAAIQSQNSKLRVTAREHRGGKWQPQPGVEVIAVPELPGFRIERDGQEPLTIEVGMLPSDKLYYRLEDKYLTMEDLSRRILDQTLFPRLPE